MHRESLSGDNCSFVKFHSTNSNFFQGFSRENPVASLVHSESFLANCVQIREILDGVKVEIIGINFAVANFLGQFFLNFWMLIDKVNQHHGRMLSCISSCSVQTGKVVYQVINKLLFVFVYVLLTNFNVKRFDNVLSFLNRTIFLDLFLNFVDSIMSEICGELSEDLKHLIALSVSLP